MTARTSAARTIWTGPLLPVSVGAIALVFLAALQALAVTTVMPVVSADLDGESLYAVAFSATLATSVIGMVGTGAWSDRRGPAVPLTLSVLLFVIGLLIAGLAPSMPIVVLGRLVQGLGAGGITVALYVVVARVFPPELHGKVFAAFSAAWVVPSLIGPFLAGAVAEYLHWRWVFHGVAVLAVVAFALIAPRLRGLSAEADTSARGRVGWRMLSAVCAAVALLALGLAGEGGGTLTLGIVAGALVVLVLAFRVLVPRGTLRAARGLPSVVLMRGVLAGAFFSAEVYVPYFFISVHGYSPVWAGLALTVAAITWSIASDIQGRAGSRWSDRVVTSVGAVLVAASLAVVALTVLWALEPAVLIVAWSLAGGGMGLVYPRLSVLTLAYSTAQDQGANSAAPVDLGCRRGVRGDRDHRSRLHGPGRGSGRLPRRVRARGRDRGGRRRPGVARRASLRSRGGKASLTWCRPPKPSSARPIARTSCA